jgi:hypothetical protein
MQNLFRLPKNHVPDQRRLLLARVVAQGIKQRRLSVAETQLDEVLADKGRIGVHDFSVEMFKVGGWISVFEAASVELFALLAKQPAALIAEADDRTEEADAEENNVIGQQAAKGHDDTSEEEDPGEALVHDLFSSSLCGHGPNEVGTGAFTRDAGERLERNGVMRGHIALTLPVIDRLLGDAQC